MYPFSCVLWAIFWSFSLLFSWLDVSVFVCALGDFLVLFAPVLRQIARYLPHHRSENASKTHPKSSHDKFKTASKFISCLFCSFGIEKGCIAGTISNRHAVRLVIVTLHD